ncbi:hypothetical protein MJM83_28850, partial [Salmonella enterica subsp. enterica serovar Montevideo]|nr:hypothetical protein [Salmonella enterica subsp. enterica serovar Montevideo]
PGLIKSGKVTMAELDDATRHVLNVKYDMGLFNDPYSHLGPKESGRANLDQVTGEFAFQRTVFRTPEVDVVMRAIDAQIGAVGII